MTDDARGAPEGGFLQMLPVYLQASMTVDRIQTNMTSWMSPQFSALLGTTPAGDPVAVVAYEWPTTWLRSVQPYGNGELEWIHAQRFRADYVAALGEHPFWSLRPGGDPPDLQADSGQGPLGIECTRFTQASRQQVYGLLRAIREQVSRVPPEHFARIYGHMVYIWFQSDMPTIGMPFASSDSAAIGELIQSLADHQPTPEAVWVEGSELASPAPALPLHHTSSGAAFYCLPMQGAVPETPFFAVHGFEVGLAYTTTHAAPAEWTSLTTQIQRKDREGNDWLLISAGAPDNRGLTYPSEEAIAQFLIEHPADVPKLEHLERVTLHLWGSGEAVDLYPEHRKLFGPVFSASVPSHRIIAPTVP